MTTPVKDRDIRALQTAIVCVGLSGVFLGVFVMLAGGGVTLLPGICSAAGVAVTVLGVMRWPSAGMGRPRRIFVYWMLSALLILELMIPLNYVTGRRRITFDWTEGHLRSLSERTLGVLTRVEKPLRVTTFFVRAHQVQGPVFNVVKDLLEEYRKANRNVIVEHVDPSRDTDKMLALQKQLNLEDLSEASVVFQYGEARKDIPMWRLMPRAAPGMPPQQQQPEDYAFHGEEEFTSAVLEVTESKRKGLYFTTGHGELSIDRDLAQIAGELRRNNYEVVKFGGLADGVPDNCTVLLIVGPSTKAKFNEAEQASVARYLARGGKLFFGVGGGGATGLEPLISDFGIEVGKDFIIDTSSGRATPTVPLQAAGYHDIINNIREYAFGFEMARSVRATPPPPAMMQPNYRRAFSLLETGRSCWAETDIDTLINKQQAEFDPKTDRRGPLGVAAVYEQPDRTPYGQELPSFVPRTRVVAVGSGDFMVGRQAGIFYIEPPQGNLLFFHNAVNWLAEKTELISIPPKRFDFRPMDKLEASDERRIFWLTTFIMPALVLVVGGLIWMFRRRS